MAFKTSSQQFNTYESIEALFRDIRTKKISALYSHQAELLKNYQKEFADSKNLALDLPTGSGKTLIGLLIGEYVRRIKKEKVLFLCSTNQLVNQVVQQANDDYGIKATAFTGSKHAYSAKDKSDYETADTIAITNYSSFFNVNPYFKDPDVIILDDAHVAENYVASNWSLAIARDEFDGLYKGLLSLLKTGLDHIEFSKFSTDDIDPFDKNTVQLIPLQAVYSQHLNIIDYLNTNLDRDEFPTLYYPWTNIKDNLYACQFYVSHKSILIRPIIPPTLTILAFEGARQRIFMSATLGMSGDLERTTGLRKIDKLPLPEGWDKQGSGRRFFVFPDMSLEDDEKAKLFVESNKMFERSLSLLPDNIRLGEVHGLVKEHLEDFKVFDAKSIEVSKSTFVNTPKAVALVANRYEGIDFEGNECRLLFVLNLSRTINLQETFLFQKMGSDIVLLDRIRTRIIQAIGRCTRGASDYSCVIAMGDDLGHYFTSNKFRKYFHPELQGEITFGIEQSKEMTLESILDNMQIFLKQGKEWKGAEMDIYQHRDATKQEVIPGSVNLSNAAEKEVDFQYYLWNKDFISAVGKAQQVINDLAGGKELDGYRGYWNYLASVACFLAEKELGLKEYSERGKIYLLDASKCTRTVSWLLKLGLVDSSMYEQINNWDEDFISNIERVEAIFEQMGVSSTKSFEKEMKAISDGLGSNDAKKFENAHYLLGKYLGFLSENKNTPGAPDPYWISNNKICIVFEDYTGSETDTIPITKTRQASDHPAWIKSNISEDLEIYSVILTDSTKLDKDAIPYSTGVYYWKLRDFRIWATSAIATIRNIRSSFAPGNAVWREHAMEEFLKSKLDPKSIIKESTKIQLKSL